MGLLWPHNSKTKHLWTIHQSRYILLLFTLTFLFVDQLGIGTYWMNWLFLNPLPYIEKWLCIFRLSITFRVSIFGFNYYKFLKDIIVIHHSKVLLRITLCLFNWVFTFYAFGWDYPILLEYIVRNTLTVFIFSTICIVIFI